jgi:DNA polymerase III subunit delta
VRLPAARVADFLRRPDPAVRAVLLFGPDAGLVRERADALARGICPDLADPFRIADLAAAQLAGDPARLADEIAAQSLVGGRRVVRVREAGDGLSKLFAETIDAAPGDGFLVAEAGELPARSSLRRAFEEAKRGAAIGCYPDTPRELAAVIRDSLGASHVGVSRDAGEYLVAHLGGDRLQTRAELEKLALYAGEGGRIELADAEAVIGDSAQLSIDDAVFAAAEGDAAALERALGRVFQEGASPVTVIRALLRHLQRLHLFAARVAGGAGVAEVLRAARPPVFFRHEDNWKRQLALWDEGRLRPLLGAVAEAEFRMKLTGFPADTVCRAALLAVAEQARGKHPPP